jgi:hypothetical protein
MSDEMLINVAKIAAENEENLALKMLLLSLAYRLTELTQGETK